MVRKAPTGSRLAIPALVGALKAWIGAGRGDVACHPVTGLRIPRLARRSEDANAVEVLCDFTTGGAKRAGQRRTDAQRCDVVPLDQLPEAVDVGHVGRAFVKNQGATGAVCTEDRKRPCEILDNLVPEGADVGRR